MTRKQKLLANTIISLVYQLVTVISGLILPRLYLLHFGSAASGLASSITQFLGFITFCELGVGAVVQSSLYKPLAENNIEETSRIVASSERFFRHIALILVAYVFALCLVYPHFNSNVFDSFYTISLIIIIAISSFAQYYFGATYRLLLNADQMGFIQFGLRSITIVINVIVSIILMNLGCGIHVVKLSASLIFLLQPIAINIYAKKKYNIIRGIQLEGEPIKQKWNGLAQHIAYVVLQNTDVAVLTLFSTLENVAVYGVYFLAVNGIRLVIESLSGGIESALGNMLANKETNTLRNSFELFEWAIHCTVSIAFSVLCLLIVPFVSAYTRGVNDADFIVPIFGILLSSAYAFYCLQIPYNLLVHAAGDYKQTQISSIIEATINVVVSIIAVKQFQLVGVAIGTLCAMSYRSVYLSLYISKNIIPRKRIIFFKHLFVDFLMVGSIVIVCRLFQINATNYGTLALYGFLFCLIGIVLAFVINTVFYIDRVKNLKTIISDRIRGR